jgi:hypothetical protein
MYGDRATRSRQTGGARVIRNLHARLIACPVFGCKERRRRWDCCCPGCWKKLPWALREAIRTEQDNCRAAGIRHSQELHAARDQAVAHLSTAAKRAQDLERNQLALAI